MAQVLTISEQYYNNAGGSLDKALEPVSSYTDLASVPSKSRYVGMEKVVLNTKDGVNYPMVFYLKNGVRNTNWMIKQIFPLENFNVLDTLTETLLEIPYNRFSIGLEVTVVADETNDGKPTKYWITAIDTASNKLTWERCNSAVSDSGVTISGNDMEESETVPAE